MAGDASHRAIHNSTAEMWEAAGRPPQWAVDPERARCWLTSLPARRSFAMNPHRRWSEPPARSNRCRCGQDRASRSPSGHSRRRKSSPSSSRACSPPRAGAPPFLACSRGGRVSVRRSPVCLRGSRRNCRSRSAARLATCIACQLASDAGTMAACTRGRCAIWLGRRRATEWQVLHVGSRPQTSVSRSTHLRAPSGGERPFTQLPAVNSTLAAGGYASGELPAWILPRSVAARFRTRCGRVCYTRSARPFRGEVCHERHRCRKRRPLR